MYRLITPYQFKLCNVSAYFTWMSTQQKAYCSFAIFYVDSVTVCVILFYVIVLKRGECDLNMLSCSLNNSVCDKFCPLPPLLCAAALGQNVFMYHSRFVQKRWTKSKKSNMKLNKWEDRI